MLIIVFQVHCHLLFHLYSFHGDDYLSTITLIDDVRSEKIKNRMSINRGNLTG